LDLWKPGAHGLIEHRPGTWAWFDHGDGIDVPVNENAWYHGALVALADAASVLGRATRERELRVRAARLAAAFEAAFWRGDAYRSGAHADDRANGLAVLMGLAPPDRFAKLRDVLVSVQQATPYMEKVVLEALFRMGFARQALARMRAR